MRRREKEEFHCGRLRRSSYDCRTGSLRKEKSKDNPRVFSSCLLPSLGSLPGTDKTVDRQWRKEGRQTLANKRHKPPAWRPRPLPAACIVGIAVIHHFRPPQKLFELSGREGRENEREMEECLPRSKASQSPPFVRLFVPYCSRPGSRPSSVSQIPYRHRRRLRLRRLAFNRLLLFPFRPN